MATKAHCLFCFEVLAASFEHREPPTLAQVEDLWEQYCDTRAPERQQHPADDDDDDDGDDDDDDDDASPPPNKRAGGSGDGYARDAKGTNDDDEDNEDDVDNDVVDADGGGAGLTMEIDEASNPEEDDDDDVDGDDDNGVEGGDDGVDGNDGRRPSSGPASRARQNLLLPIPGPAAAAGLSASGSSASTPSSSSSLSVASSRTPASTLASTPNSSRSSLLSGRRLSRLAAKSSSSSSSSSSGGGKRATTAAAAEIERPLFVTWNTIGRSGQRSLRGCIGTFDAQPLESGLRNYAMTSAFEDTRFMPITKKELRTLEVGVTLLTDFEPAPTPTAWTLGTHGLRIAFTAHGRRYAATYLPDVPVAQGWTHEDTLVSLMRKAGWAGRRDEWRRVAGLRVVRYQGRKALLPHAEWLDWRRWAERQRLLL